MPDPADWPDAAPVLGLPYLQPSQAQKHVTVNEGLRTLDAVVQLAVADRTRNEAPPLPDPGDRHIVGPAPTGVWAGQAGRVALWEAAASGAGAWVFLDPGPGWRAWVAAEGAVVTFDGAAWVGPEALALRAARAGVGTDADATNRLAVASPATLLTHTGAGHQVKVNKAAPADTASLLFQTGFSGRAEMGTAGSDAFAVKVSADGAAWATALTADPATGRASLPGGLRLPAGSAAAPAAAFESDPNTGFCNPAADQIGFVAGGVQRAVLSAAALTLDVPLGGAAVVASATDTTAGRLLTTGAGAAQAFRRGNVLAAVAQAGGVPSGGLIERGSNASGEYVRFADGTQIAWREVTVSLAINVGFMGGFRSGGQNSQYAAAFAATPATAVYPLNSTAFGAMAQGSPSTVNWSWAVTAVTSQAAADRTVHLLAVGRWF